MREVPRTFAEMAAAVAAAEDSPMPDWPGPELFDRFPGIELADGLSFRVFSTRFGRGATVANWVLDGPDGAVHLVYEPAHADISKVLAYTGWVWTNGLTLFTHSRKPLPGSPPRSDGDCPVLGGSSYGPGPCWHDSTQVAAETMGRAVRNDDWQGAALLMLSWYELLMCDNPEHGEGC